MDCLARHTFHVYQNRSFQEDRLGLIEWPISELSALDHNAGFHYSDEADLVYPEEFCTFSRLDGLMYRYILILSSSTTKGQERFFF